MTLEMLTLLLAGVAIYSLPPISSPEKTKSPKSVDLRANMKKWGLETRAQGSRGTCSVFALTGAIEYAVARKQKHGTTLSIEYLNWAGHKAANRTVDGGFFSELWSGYKEFGICPESDVPYQQSFDVNLQPTTRASEAANTFKALNLKLHWIKEWDVHSGLTDKHIEQIKAVLIKKWPVCGGLRWPKQEKWTDGTLNMCTPDEVFDGHSILIVGFKDDPKADGGGVFLIRNSGGPGRDGALPYSYVRAYMNDAAWIQ